MGRELILSDVIVSLLVEELKREFTRKGFFSGLVRTLFVFK